MSLPVYSCVLMIGIRVMDGIRHIEQEAAASLINHPVWFWLFIIQVLIIIVLVHFLLQKKIHNDFAELNKEQVKDYGKTGVDMVNVVNSIHDAEKLYKELSRKCHPDRFLGDSRHAVAEALFQKISDNRRNHDALQMLKTEVEEKLFTNL